MGSGRLRRAPTGGKGRGGSGSGMSCFVWQQQRQRQQQVRACATMRQPATTPAFGHGKERRERERARERVRVGVGERARVGVAALRAKERRAGFKDNRLKRQTADANSNVDFGHIKPTSVNFTNVCKKPAGWAKFVDFVAQFCRLRVCVCVCCGDSLMPDDSAKLRLLF